MTAHRVELLGGPRATKTVLDFPDGPPAELPVNLERGPAIRGEEQAAAVGHVLTQAMYRHHETDAEGVEVYVYSHERRVYG